VDTETRRLWEGARRLLEPAAQEAKRLTVSLGGTGLRRGEICNAAGRQLGILGDDMSFSKPKDLIDAVNASPGHSAIIKDIEFMVNVVNVCYELNQARGLERSGITATPNIPGPLSRAAGIIIPELASPDYTSSPDQVFEHVVTVPRVSALRNAKSSELV